MKRKFVFFIVAALLLAVLFLLTGNNDRDTHVLRIMPLGDSITQGQGGFDSYRRPLWLMLQESGAKVDFVGSMKMNFSDAEPLHADFDMDHEGHWGWKADEILARADEWAGKFQPDIVLLHLGSNDILRKEPDEQTVDEISQIISVFRKQNPRVKIFVAALISVADERGDRLIRRFNALLPPVVERLNSEESPVILVDQFEGFDAWADTYDRIHPNEAGVQKMARKWFEALLPVLSVEP